MYHSQVAITRNERKLFDIFYEIALLKGSAIREQVQFVILLNVCSG